MKIAFVIQRYGTEILGGSEFHCRMIAERLALRHDVEVLTTCALDYVTWKNDYPEGLDRIKGVTVRRFPTSQERDIQDFNRYSDWIFNYPHSAADEMDWLRRQGPWSPALVEYIERRQRDYDVLIFFTYLYAPTVLGLKANPGKSLLVPTAHDEPAIRLDLYRTVFALPAGIAFNTAAERRFLLDTFDIAAVAQDVVGCGVDLPASLLDAERPERGDRRPEADPDTEARPHLAEPGAAFRRRHRLFGPIMLYGGRIDPGKGCEELIEYFSSYRRQGGEATLALMGAKLMPIPEEPWIRFAGLLSDTERGEAFEAATVVVVPSPHESLSLLALEAFAVGTPILANARSEVLVEHCRQSNAGLYYADRDEFAEGAKLLLADRALRGAMGRNGREYVRRHYRWDVVLSKYDALFAAMRGE